MLTRLDDFYFGWKRLKQNLGSFNGIFKIKHGRICEETICLTDLLATCAAITGDKLPDNAGEDSCNILPALLGHDYEKPIRAATVHHSINGSFSIRQGKWKLELCPGSGGWSAPKLEEAGKMAAAGLDGELGRAIVHCSAK